MTRRETEWAGTVAFFLGAVYGLAACGSSDEGDGSGGMTLQPIDVAAPTTGDAPGATSMTDGNLGAAGGTSVQPVDPTDPTGMPAQSPTPMPMEMPSEMMPAQTPPPAVDCTNIPAGPFKLDSVAGATASEDLAFDNMGNLIGSDDFSIYKATSAGNKTVFVPNMQFRAGLRALPTGDLVVADNTTGSLVRIDASGTKHTVKSGLVYPNGLEVDMEGRVYVTEHDARRVRRIDPYSGDEAIVVDGDIENPNGLSFSPDYRTLYIGGFSGAGIIYALAIGEDGTPGALTEWATGVGTGYLDGMGVDACGNVYVCDYEGYAIYRISATDKKRVLIIDGNDAGLYLPNLQWGSGVGGWDPLTLYIPDGENHGVYKTSIGVPSKPRAYP